MKFPNILLSLFAFFATLCFIGIIAENSMVFMIGKTAVFPCLFFYYVDQVKNINMVFVIMLLIFYSVDLIIVADFPEKEKHIEILLNINHLIILYLTILNVEKKPIDYKIMGFSMFMFILGCAIQYLVFDIMQINFPDLAFRIFISGIFVSIFNSISLYNYLKRNCYVYYYFGFACLSLGLMYAFFNMYKYVFNIQTLRLLSLSFKIIAYFLFVKYIIAREKRDCKLKFVRQQ